jgi:hypothetical protein
MVSRRSFVRRASRPRRALLLGFFVFDHAEDDEQAMLQPRFVPCPGGPAGWRCPYIPRLDPRCLDMDPVLCRNGYLLLSRVALATPTGTTAINYCVCNPATGSCYFLPPYDVDQDIGFWEYSCALLTGRDFKHRVSSRCSFELVVAGIPTGRQELLVSVFSSRTMQWSSVRSVEIPMFFIDSYTARRYDYEWPSHYNYDMVGRPWTYLEMQPRSPPAVRDGSICWQCTCDGTERVMLMLDLRGQCDVTLLHLPNETETYEGQPYSGSFGFLLGCRDDGVLRTFALAEDRLTLTMCAWLEKRRGGRNVMYTHSWRPSGEIDLRTAITDALGTYSGCDDSDIGVKLLWYCEKSNVLVFTTAALGNFSLDLDTKRADALGNILRCKSESCARYACISSRACPYEMDCPPDWITTK